MTLHTRSSTQSASPTVAPPLSRRKLWFAAIKPPMYSVAVMPIWVGSAAAYATTGQLDLPIFFTFLLSAICILAWENLSNDVFDADTGVDVHKFNSLVNITGNQRLIFWISNALLALGLSGIGAIAVWQQDVTVLGLILLACAIGYIYQGPPFRLSYQGLGEILCFIAFGPVAFAAVSYSQTQSWNVTTFAAGTVVALATSLILFTSHFNQVREDAAIGKKSPVVRLGARRAAQLLPWWCGTIYGLTVLFIILGIFPVATLLVGVSLPWARRLCRDIWLHHEQPEKLTFCRLITVTFHFWLGLMLGVGFFIGY